MCGLIVNNECNIQLSAVYKQLSVSQHTTNIKLSPVAYNSTEIPLSSIYPSLALSLSLSPSVCLSVFLSLSFSLSHCHSFELRKKKPLSSIYPCLFLFQCLPRSIFLLCLSFIFPWLGTRMKSHLCIHPSLLFFSTISFPDPPFLSPSPDGGEPTYLFIFSSIRLFYPSSSYSSLIVPDAMKREREGGRLPIPASNVTCQVISETITSQSLINAGRIATCLLDCSTIKLMILIKQNDKN